MIRLSTIDSYVDYLPFVSTATNFGILLYKITFSAENRNYFTNKSITRSATSLVPIAGNISLLVYDYFNQNKEYVDPATVEEWLADPSAYGRVEEAARRIRLRKDILDLKNLSLNKVLWEMHTDLSELQLECNQLKALPKQLGLLTNLTYLTLCINKLTALPTEIGLLTKLKLLNLDYNQLKSLPGEIGQLTALTQLCLSNNQLTSLPAEISHLTNLSHLTLAENQLTTLHANIGQLQLLEVLWLNVNRLVSLPPEIGLLDKVIELDLTNNQLTSLPVEIGNMLRMQNLRLEQNPDLRELPLSLGMIEGLTHVDISNTRIDEGVNVSILTQCRLRRDAGSHAILPTRLNKWIAMAKSNVDLTKMEEFSEAQKINVNEWLVRLERTQDYAYSQASLAVTVCGILNSVLNHPPFQELFFTQIEANNECCHDRAAMSLNEIYTSWKIMCSPADSVQMMTGTAKTLRLRKAIARLIDQRQKETKTIERESVEIYLYYETLFRDVLQLETAMTRMAYSDIGKRSWIDEKRLIHEVNTHYFEDLYELPIFQHKIEPLIKSEWDKLVNQAHAQLQALGDIPDGNEHDPQVLEYQWKKGEISQALEQAKFLTAKKWLE